MLSIHHFPILSIFSLSLFFFLIFFHHTHNFNFEWVTTITRRFFFDWNFNISFYTLFFRENSSFWVEITFQWWWSSREGTGIYFVLLQHFFVVVVYMCMFIPDKWNIYSRIIVIIIKKEEEKRLDFLLFNFLPGGHLQS